MRPLHWLVGAVLLGSLGLPNGVFAQCTEGLDQEQILDLIETDLTAESPAIPVESLVDAPETGPVAKQLVAPSSTAASTSLVDEPGFTNFLGLAIDNDLLSSESNALTVNLNLFAFKTAVQPRAMESQQLYGSAQNTLLRRFGGAVTLGGKGAAFDQDGDGDIDEAIEAKELQDSVSWELRYRFWGTRDRRDDRNFQRLETAVFDLSSKVEEMAQSILGDLFQSLGSGDTCIERAEVESFLAKPEIRLRRQGLAGRVRELRAATLKVNEKIDSSVIWSLVAGGIDREDQLGPEEKRVGIRGAFGSENSDRNWTLNLDWTETEGLLGASDPTTLRAALQLSTLWLEGLPLSPDGITVSVGGAYEMFEDVPAAAYDTNAKLNVKLEYPLSRTMSIPISLTWANHKDLIEGEDELRGHIGFTLDLGKLLRPEPDGPGPS
jgi:hypothetical protein